MIIRGDRDGLEGKAAWILAENIQSLLASQGHVVLALPGGRSVDGVFRHLVRENIDWERVHIFMVDERLVPHGHPESNFTVVAEGLQEILFLTTAHPLVCSPGQEDAGIEAYRQELSDLGGRFDIVLLSCGEDGHIASLFPGCLESDVEQNDFLLVRNSPKPPPARITASARLLARSQVGIGLLFGEEKRRALQGLFDENITVQQCPAKIIRHLPQHYILTDQELCP